MPYDTCNATIYSVSSVYSYTYLMRILTTEDPDTQGEIQLGRTGRTRMAEGGDDPPYDAIESFFDFVYNNL